MKTNSQRVIVCSLCERTIKEGYHIMVEEHRMIHTGVDNIATRFRDRRSEINKEAFCSWKCLLESAVTHSERPLLVDQVRRTLRFPPFFGQQIVDS